MSYRRQFRHLPLWGALFLPVIVPGVHAAELGVSNIALSRDAIHRLRTSPHPDLVLPIPGGGPVALQLVPFDLFAPGATITETGHRGPRALRPDVTFLKGMAGGADSTWSALTVTPRGVSGHVQIGRREFQVVPGAIHPDGSTSHSIQESRPDPTTNRFKCGSDDLPTVQMDRTPLRMLSPEATSRAGLRLTCDLAIDCDYELYANQFGGEVDRLMDHLLATLATLSVLYERDINVAMRVAYLNLWTIPDDPYTSTDRGVRLDEFIAYWRANRGDVPRTLAHLLTGLVVGGLAYIDVLCGSYGYGLSSMAGTGSYPATPNNLDLRILAHELGHNFGSRHTQSCFWQDRGFTSAGALLDSCVDAEGSCYKGPANIVPPEGGTIMSYCPVQHLDFHPACRSYMRTQSEYSCMLADSVQPPRNLTATFEPATVTLSWDPGGSDGVVGYEVYRSRYPVDATPTIIGTTSATSFTDTRGIQPVYYKVRAVRLGDQSGFSAEVLVADHIPVVGAPAAVEGIESTPLSFTVAASDPDLEPIQSLTASQLPTGAVFTADPTMTQGRLEWTPACQQAGIHEIIFTASAFTSGSAATLVTVLPVDCPPVVTAPDVVTGREGELLFLEVSAMDREDPLFDLTAAPLPGGASFSTSEDFTSGILIWAPGYAQAGTYPVTFTATNGMRGAATTRIEIANSDRPPTVGAPRTASTIPGLLVQVHVTASDPDAEPIGSLEASGLPPGASFTVGATKTTADLRWFPSAGQEGSYPVTFTAANALSTSATTRIDVLSSADHPPAVSTPTPVNGSEGALLEVHVSAADPDGDPILSLSSGPLPGGATFLTDAGGAGATMSWTPGFDQAGGYEVALTAVSKAGSAPALTGIATMTLSIQNTDRAPGVLAPGDVTVSEGALLSFGVTAGDPDGDPIESLGPDLATLPLGNDARFSVEGGNGQGTLTWTPAFSDAGDYGLTFTATNALDGSAHTTVHVLNTNRSPSAAAGGPYQGFIGIPLSLNGGGSTDTDGDPLTYLWDFGDQTQGVGVAPSHAYATGGDFPVSLTVSDGTLSGQDATTAHIALMIEADAYVTERNKTIRLRSAKPTWCALIESTTPSFDPASVDPASIVLAFNGAQIFSAPARETIIGDWDRDGLPELPVCFSKADLRTLFSSLPAGKHTAAVQIEGALLQGGRVRAQLQIDVVSDEASFSATIAPNPATPDATLTFVTQRAGRAKISLFDSQGRLVRMLFDEPTLPAGYHDLRAIGVDAEGKRLPSGIYFYRIETPQGTSTGRFAITR